MTKVLILGANRQIARQAERFLAADTDMELTLYLRNKERLADFQNAHEGVTLVEGDILDKDTLSQAVAGKDVVSANLAGNNIKEQAEHVVAAMTANKVKRLIWISTLGIYDEVPGKFGEWNNKVLGDYITHYRSAADVIEGSKLDYTVIRPAWLTDKTEVDYELTQKNEDFKGTEVSRKSIAAFVYHLILNPKEQVKKSVGVNKPNTAGDKPSWY